MKTYPIEIYNTKTRTTFVFCLICLVIAISNLLVSTQKYTDNLNVYVLKQLMLILFIAYLFIMYKSDIDVRKMMILFCLVFVVSSLNMFGSNGFKSTLIMNSLMYSATALVIFIFPKITRRDFLIMLSVFLIAISVIVTIPSLLSLNDASLYTFYEGRLRFLGVMDNENTFGKTSLLATILSVRLWTHWKGSFKKSFLLFMIFSSVYLIYLSNSRTSLFTLMILLGAYVLFKTYEKVPRKIFISLVSFLSCIPILLVLYFLNNNTFNIDLNELTTGRVSIWQEMIWGMDWNGYIVGMGEGIGRSSHNGYLEIFRYFGILGVLLWFPLLIYLFVKKWNHSKRNNDLLGFAIIFSLMFYYLTEGALVSLASLFAIYFWLELLWKNNGVAEREHTVH